MGSSSGTSVPFKSEIPPGHDITCLVAVCSCWNTHGRQDKTAGVHCKMLSVITFADLCLRIGESPSISPILKNNGDEAPKGPSPITFQEWTDTRTFSDLKCIPTKI